MFSGPLVKLGVTAKVAQNPAQASRLVGEMSPPSLTMKTATVADLRNRFPSVFRWLEDGETVELTKRGKIIARIVPAPPAKPRKFKMPDFEAMRREIYGDDVALARGGFV